MAPPLMTFEAGLAAMYPQSPVLALDSNFTVYRKNGRQVIVVIQPAA